MTTRIEAYQMSYCYPYKIYHRKEEIRGGDADNPYPHLSEGFDTMRLIALYSKGFGDSQGHVYLNAYNLVDKAICVLDLSKRPNKIDPIHVSVNNKLIDAADYPTWGPNQYRWEIYEGDVFKVWFGKGRKFEKRNENIGSAVVKWEKPQQTTS